MKIRFTQSRLGLTVFVSVIALMILGAGCSKSNTDSPATESGSVTLSAMEVSKHGTSRDCWLIINGRVYDATNFLPRHPGGMSRITPYCGKDATQAFATQGGQGSHDARADSELASLELGALGETITL